MDRLGDSLRRAQTLQDAGAYMALRSLAQEMLDLAEERGEAAAAARACTFLGVARMRLGEAQEASIALEAAVTRFTAIGDDIEAARAKMNLGALALDVLLDVDLAERWYDEALPVVERSHHEQLLGIALANIAEIHRLKGRLTEALDAGTRALDIFERLGESWRHALMLVTNAHVYSLLDDFPHATALMQRARMAIVDSKNPLSMLLYIEVYAVIMAEHRDEVRAVRLFGFAERYRRRHGIPTQQGLLPWIEPALQKLRTSLGNERFEHLCAEGAAMSDDEAHALVNELAFGVAAKQ